MSLKLIVSDIDGVWTDGGMYYNNDGVESKKFSTSDGVGVLLARAAGIEIMIVSGENVQCVKNRMKKLKISNYHLGVKDKVKLLETYAKKQNISFSEIAFIGDEINDYNLLKKVGFSGCPSDAPFYTREIVDVNVNAKGGHGAFRDFVIEILKKEDRFDSVFDQVINGYRQSNKS